MKGVKRDVSVIAKSGLFCWECGEYFATPSAVCPKCGSSYPTTERMLDSVVEGLLRDMYPNCIEDDLGIDDSEDCWRLHDDANGLG